MLKKFFFISVLLFLSCVTKKSYSSHLMGGEITWECLKTGVNTGSYIFTLKVYRDCNGITVSTFSQTITVWGHPTVTTITADFISQQDVSPICDPINSGNQQYSCANGDLGAVEEYVFQSQPIQLAGIPSAAGWHFTWNNCCRNAAIVNMASSQEGFTLRATMYPYTDPVTGVQVPADPCFDSSPNFKEQPKTILCTGFPFSYNHNASDPELDNLVYDWAYPLDDDLFNGPIFNPQPAGTAGANPSELAFQVPYSVNSPLPGAPQLDPNTGEITYDANTAGFFVTCVKVQAYKCGQLVAEVFREVQVVLIACPTMPGTGALNNPPNIDRPFTDPVTSLPSYEATVYAGTLVNFNITGQDSDLYPGSIAQDLTMEVSGGQFSDDFINTNSCNNPPCATFNNGAGLTPPFSAPGIVNGVFEWQTSCNHINAILGCGATTSTFTFLVKVHDDFCPAFGITIATITITVVPPIPDLRCISVLENGNIELNWQYAPGAPPTLEPYFVYRKSSSSTNFELVDSVFFPSTSFIDTDPSLDGNLNEYQYFLATDQSCGISTGQLQSDTLTSILLNSSTSNLNTVANLSWNNNHDPLLLTSDTVFDVYMKRDNNSSQEIIDSTSLLTYTYNADFIVPICNYDPVFQIHLEDLSGCRSKSSFSSVNLNDTLPPDIPLISDISVDNNNKAVINWLPIVGADMYIIYIKDEDGSQRTLDTVFTNSYTYLQSAAGDKYETFLIRALDSCENASDYSSEHNSIHLQTVLDACLQTLTLEWNDYVNWTGGVSTYEIDIVSTSPSGNIQSFSYSLLNNNPFVFTDAIDKYNYEIFIRAYNLDSTFQATSNKISVIPNLSKKPDYNYIEYASVNMDNGYVDISCLVDNSAVVDYYSIYRSISNNNNFTKIGEIPFNGQENIFYTDNDALTSKNSYDYMIFPVDTCGVTISTGSVLDPYTGLSTNDTSIATTILLKTQINLEEELLTFSSDEYINTITFNEYANWLGNVDKYELYRSANRQPFVILPIYTFDRNSNPNESLKYNDLVTDFGEQGNGRFCYYVKASEGLNNTYGPTNFGSYSNISCISQTPIIYLPNSFTPNRDEHNELYIPVTYFVSEDGYLFSIFDRSGNLIFETNDPKKGWDGSYKGNLVQNGTYVYILKYINGVGNLINKTGPVNVIK
ncbi:gliding motility-associated C-terminal domain-containing protein [Bacteroidota bacterium]|nr:gliding motility-associated C-terminal domain-containing protein [Bacteroidota bacterium]